MNDTHCSNCGALIEKALCIDGLGVRCGCLKKRYTELKKQVIRDSQASFDFVTACEI